MSSCEACGGLMIGDGYTSVEHCEFSEPEYMEPDAGPVYCTFED